MDALGILILLYLVAGALLVAEIFIPSHGILTVVGVAFLIGAIVKTFDYGNTAGAASIVTSAIALPVMAIVAVKMWPDTRIGRLIAPLNPVYKKQDSPIQVSELEMLVGKYGQTLTPLRPVGTCEFAGHRIQCVAESGMIEAGVGVKGIGVRGSSLAVVVAENRASA